MKKHDNIPTLDYDDDEPIRSSRQQQRKPSHSLPPFVILKRCLSVFSALFGVAMIVAMSQSPDVGINGAASEDTQIIAYIFATIPIAVGAWLWGGRDPD